MRYDVVFSVTGTVTVKVDATDRDDAIHTARKQLFIETDFGELENIDGKVVYTEPIIPESEDDELNLVKCMDCGWIGITDELESGGSLSGPYCPHCGAWENIVPLDPSIPVSCQDVAQLWDIFCSMVELSSTHRTACGFFIFPEGTYKDDVFDWFAQNYEGGIPALNKAIGRK